MENCTIYSHELDFDQVVSIVQKHLPKAKIDVSDSEEQKSLTATLKGGLFGKTKKLTLNCRQRLHPSYTLKEVECPLTQNLAGMVNYIQSLPAENEDIRNKLVYKVMAANYEMPFMVEPELTEEYQAILQEIIQRLDSFVFASPNKTFKASTTQHFLDKNLKLILDTEGKCGIADLEVNVNAKYYDQPAQETTEDQRQRQQKSEAFLEQHQVKVNQKLPCIVSIEEVELRPTPALLDRVYALLIVAAKGEGVEQEQLEKVISEKMIHSFSPQETAVLENDSLTDQEKAYATWRYEGLYTLLWALGIMDELKYPNEICDVSAVVSKIFQPSREEFENSIQRRTKEEILDELDKIYRMNWACVDARIKGEQVTGGIEPGVVYERHYALNWLTQYQNQDWDDVQTNT